MLLRRYTPVILFLLSAVATVLVYVPFAGKMDEIYRYWDGPLYIYVAKVLYMIPKDHPFVWYKLPQYYFSCHLPMFPLSIRLFASLGFGYLQGMLMTMIFTSGMLSVALYYFFKETKYVKYPFWSTVLLIFFPLRMLLYRSVGASEPLFMLFILLSLLFFKKERYGWAFLLGSLASVTRILGVLLFVPYFIILFKEKKYRELILLPLMGLPLFLTFLFYKFEFGNFFAYFQYNGQMLNADPTLLFRAYSFNGDSHSAELYFLMLLVYGIGTLQLAQKKEIFYFSLSYFIFMLFVFHQDIGRYFLPIAPFALVVGFDNILSHKRALLLLLLVPYVYFYTWGMIPFNLVADFVWNGLVKIL